MKPQTSLMEYCATKFNTFKNFLYTNYGENPGKMLVHTGVLGWILSSAAQVAAVVINDKISPKDKVFLIPQECADAAVNILSFYLVTNSFKAVGSKLVQSGKLVTKPIKNFLNEKQLCSQVGKIDFDITKQPGFDKISDDYKTFKNGTYNEGFRHSWGASYKGIRQASIFIQNVDMNMKITEQEKADFKAQARFVRAYYYWLLLRRYGPIPLLPDEGLDYTDSYEATQYL